MKSHNLSIKVKDFDFLTCPLEGSNLLEASAGTGKTFSLMFLYLRLLLESQLSVKEILVATFTNAAKAEIRERIFIQLNTLSQLVDRLGQMTGEPLDCLNKLEKETVTDSAYRPLIALLYRLLSGQTEQIIDLKILEKRLRLARLQFDTAQIYSIDGFARHLLVENSDTLGCYVPETVLNDDKTLVEPIYQVLAKDNFQVLGEQADAVAEVVASKHYETLIEELTAMVSHFDWLARSSQTVLEAANRQQQLIKYLIETDHTEALGAIRQAIINKQLDGRIYSLSAFDKFTEQLSDEACYLRAAGGKSPAAFLRFFSYSQLLDKRKATDLLFDYPLCHGFEQLVTQHRYLVSGQAIVNYQQMMLLAEAVISRLPDEKATERVMTFADITAWVSAAAEKLSLPIKAALIDEAQDTNREQLALFEKLFMGEKATDKDLVCFFVGDPKQAIYGFRGANIYSYLEIQQLVNHRYQLTTNFRSSKSLNDSINVLFSGRQPFLDSRIDYHPIQSNQQNSGTALGEQALTLLPTDGKTVNAYAETIAYYIQQLLSQPDKIVDGILTPESIAVLVRTAAQGQAVKQALARYGYAASFIDKRSSVYETPEASLLYWLMYAIYTEDSRVVRGLMLTSLLGCSVAQAQDDQLVAKVTRKLAACLPYYERGVAVMFNQLIQHFSIAGRLLRLPDGRRKLTNFLHLIECLQTACQEQSLSLYGLCDWLAQNIQQVQTENELRLEDDKALTIMTMHSAKGLEFPVVCLPYFDYARDRSSAGDSVIVSHQDEQATLSSLKNQILTEKVLAEEQAEQRRLAYVALTRAKYHNIVVVNHHRVNPKTMYHTLIATLQDKEKLFKAAFVQCLDLQSNSLSEPVIPQVDTPIYQALRPQKQHFRQWWLDSFSRLQQHQPKLRNFTQADENEVTTPLLSFPKGAKAGNAIHAIYEYYMSNRQQDKALLELIDKQCYRYLSATVTDTGALAENIIETTRLPLADLGFCLADICPTQQSIEMKFFMYLTPAQRQYWYQDFGQRVAQESEGFVHGYIDYWFAHQGRYYLLDYKSNFLGNRWADYHQQAMEEEMQAAGYHQQAKIYTVALCRHLMVASQAGYEKKIGGYLYLFVRGMQANSQGRHQEGVYYNRFPWRVIAPLLTTGEQDV